MWTVGDEEIRIGTHREIRLGPVRLMSHGARAQLASDWSAIGLLWIASVTLHQRWMPASEAGFRGQSPTSFLPFFRSTLRASHAAMFVGIFRMVVVLIHASPVSKGGERLCEAYEIYLEWGSLEATFGIRLPPCCSRWARSHVERRLISQPA